MSLASLMTHSMDVETIASTPARDSSGGIVDTFTALYFQVPCARAPVSDVIMREFALAGVSIKEIQVLAGHKSITMSARYAHLSPEASASASERLVIA